MKTPGEDAFVEQIRQQLASHADAVDDLTAARLAQARRRALQVPHRSRRWRPVAGIAAAAAAVVFTLTLLTQPSEDDGAMWMVQDDIEIIEELEFYAWLEDTQPSS